MNRRIAILGSTGSIGRQTLELLADRPEMRVCALGAGNNWRLLAEQARQFRPEIVGLAGEVSADRLRGELPDGVAVLAGQEAMSDLIRRTRPDIVLSAVVGAAALTSTLAAIECGATLALANKESLACAGRIVIPSARRAGVTILPVDSEHSGVFQCLQAGERSDVRRIVLTASGGALRDFTDDQAARAGVEEALAHPTWRMGRKITIDSATLMNKALEILEAHWLFDLPADQIEVVLHPQSIVHAMVEFQDGSVLAQLAAPDMKGPIAFALSYPQRPRRPGPTLDLTQIAALEFRPPAGRFQRAVNLAYEAIRLGGCAGAVLNAANEAAVEAFLDRKIPFGRIVPLVEDTLQKAAATQGLLDLEGGQSDETGMLQRVLAADAWARRQVREALMAPTRG